MSHTPSLLSRENLSGLDKASILLLSLPEDQGTKLLKSLHPDEVQLLSKHMSTLGTVQPELIETLFKEFSEKVENTGSVRGDYASTENILLKVFEKDKVEQMMREIRGPVGRTTWDKLSNVSEDILVSYLSEEKPQTIAVILSRIKPDHASKVLSRFPHEVALEIVKRMLKTESIQRDILENIENTLKNEFVNSLGNMSQSDPYERMAEIFNTFDRTTEQRFMSALEASSRDSAERIKSLMFTFVDLTKLDNAGIQTLIRVSDKGKLTLALKGASEHIKELFIKNMSERAWKMMQGDMESMGPVRLKDVDEAQAEIVLQAKDLLNSGQIVLLRQDTEEEEMIE